MAEQQWYYAEDNQQRGPVSLEALRQLVRDGKVGPKNLIWSQGMKDWQEAWTVRELHPAPSQQQAAPATPPAPPAADVSPGRDEPVRLLPPQPVTASSVPPRDPAVPIDYRRSSATSGNYKGTATAAFVLALVGFIASCGGIGFIFAIIGLVLAINAMAGMKREGNMDGHGMAIA